MSLVARRILDDIPAAMGFWRRQCRDPCGRASALASRAARKPRAPLSGDSERSPRFGVSRSDIEDIARRFDPLTVRPRELADALADTIRERREASAYAVEDGRMF